MSRWFLNAGFEDLKHDNVLEWLAWSLCGGADLDRLRDGGDEEGERLLVFLDKALELVEARSAHKFPPGRAEGIKSIRLELDPVQLTSRPLLIYVVVNALQWWALYKADRLGFKRHRQGDIEYLLRLPESWTPEKATHTRCRPLIFVRR